MRRIFISHSHGDSEAAHLLADSLRAEGLEIWLADEQVVGGQDIKSALAAGVESTDAVVALLSKRSQKSQWLSLEVATAISQGKRVIPVLLEKDAKIPLVLQDRAWLILSDDIGYPEAAQRIAQAVAIPSDPEKDLRKRTDQVSLQRAEIERERELARQVHEKREIELRTRSFTVMFVLICAAGAALFYILDQGKSEFNPVWLTIGILVGAATAQIGNLLRIKKSSANLEQGVDK